MICPICNSDIKSDDPKQIYPLERPYMNVLVHRECYKTIYPIQREYFSDVNNLNRFIETYNKKPSK